MRKNVVAATLLLGTGLSNIWLAPAFAQTAGAEQRNLDSEIIVTARKRDETSIAVPVNLTAIGSAELERRAINNIDSIARVVPSLIVGEGGGTVQGGIIAIRGIAGADQNPFNDQAVSFNVDGVQVARATVRRMSEMDLQQVEVLKGPQALFFGKNSPGGIISIRTADPTPTLEAKLSGGYEFNAREVRTEGYVAGPLGEGLGFRIAGYFSDMQGWAKYVGPESGANVYPSTKGRAPNSTDFAIRGTLKWDPSDRFSARFKFTYGKVSNNGATANTQFVSCPAGMPASGAIDDCKADDKTVNGTLGPNFGLVDSRFGDGQPKLNQTQILSGLELNYDITDALKLTSVTGYYKAKLRNRANFTYSYVGNTILASFNFLDVREISEEVRLTSDFDGPFNFMLGGLYQDSKAGGGSVTLLNANAPTRVNNYYLKQEGTAYSLFGQMMIDVLPTLELSLGARYSSEKKALTTVKSGPVLIDIPPAPGQSYKGKWNDFSPEATLSFRPSTNLTIYGSYKEGFLSGGFMAGSTNFNGNLRYDQQTVKGFEGGVKAALLDGALRTNFALYNYKTSGLQVSVAVLGTIQELRNAGSVRTKGAEFDFTYRTPLQGLTLNGAVSYNKGRYLDYQASCYRGQSSDLCFLQVNRATGGTALLQDLSGTPLVRAPEWTGNLGFNYETPINEALKIGLSGNFTHSDGYFTDPSSPPGSWQKGYDLVDASLRVGTIDDRYEVALIGRNLTDKYYFVRTTDTAFSGSAPGLLPGAGGVRGDTAGPVSRGREIMLRLSVKFGG